MTGYLMVPNAEVVPDDRIILAWNDHFSYQNGHGGDKSLVLGTSVVPFTEAVGRFAFPDFSVNAKVGLPLVREDWMGIGVAVGVQDVWGGARIFHSKYLVGTVVAGPLESSLGWGTGGDPMTPRLKITVGHAPPQSRLDGWFHGMELNLSTMLSPVLDLPVRWSLLEEHDGSRSRLGTRARWECGSWSLEGLAGSRVDTFLPEIQGSIAYHLTEPAASYGSADPSPTAFVLQAGPWVQSMVGTEVSNFDAQFSLDLEGFATPSLWGDRVSAASRIRQSVYTTDNFRQGGAFAKSAQRISTWWEAGALAWSSDPHAREGILLQGGWLEGDWTGSSLEWRSGDMAGWRFGSFAGAWWSPGYHEKTWVALPSIDWDSPRRSWLLSLDGGRFFARDWCSRLRFGRRFGRLSLIAGLTEDFRERDLHAEGRLALDLGGIEHRFGEHVTVRPKPKFSQGLRTRIVTGENDLNWIAPSLAREPDALLRLRQ